MVDHGGRVSAGIGFLLCGLGPLCPTGLAEGLSEGCGAGRNIGLPVSFHDRSFYGATVSNHTGSRLYGYYRADTVRTLCALSIPATSALFAL